MLRWKGGNCICGTGLHGIVKIRKDEEWNLEVRKSAWKTLTHSLLLYTVEVADVAPPFPPLLDDHWGNCCIWWASSWQVPGNVVVSTTTSGWTMISWEEYCVGSSDIVDSDSSELNLGYILLPDRWTREEEEEYLSDSFGEGSGVGVAKRSASSLGTTCWKKKNMQKSVLKKRRNKSASTGPEGVWGKYNWQDSQHIHYTASSFNIKKVCLLSSFQTDTAKLIINFLLTQSFSIMF